MKAINIQWDIDDEYKEIADIPEEIEIPDNITDEDEISDYISDETGFCHKGYQLVERFGVSDIVTLKETGKEVLIIHGPDADEDKYTVNDMAGNEFKVNESELDATEASYEVPVTWEMCGTIRVFARNAAEAMAKAEKELDYIDIPDNGECLDDSFEVEQYTEPNELWPYQHAYQKLRSEKI